MAYLLCGYCEAPAPEETEGGRACKQCSQPVWYCEKCLKEFRRLTYLPEDDPRHCEADLFLSGESCPDCADAAKRDMNVDPAAPPPPREEPDDEPAGVDWAAVGKGFVGMMFGGREYVLRDEVENLAAENARLREEIARLRDELSRAKP